MNESRINYRGIPGKGYMWSDEDGISWAVLAENALIEVEDAIQLTELARQTYKPEQPFLLILDARQITGMSNEARNYGVNNSFSSMLKAMAIVVDSPATRILANFYMKFNRPRIPTRIFSDTETARAWLLATR
ncbi:MAG: STAS/SEC14 domain-containing protein [Bacteroidetes bacterium]|nr:STAS/SEC14 domain-containing protein [Bacteroidota bacterium]